ncbi:MAG: HAD family acid phosphatase [Methylococcales bacterium]|nr:HAD family acid phosphatase [Methylococcales bacterium]
MSPLPAYAFLLTALLATTSFAEPPNLGQLKTELRHYHDSGRYEHEIQIVATRASRYIARRVQQNHHQAKPQKFAMVLDIDETSLSNYNRMIHKDFSGDRDSIHRHILAAHDPAILPVLNLYQTAIKQGVHVFFVTGRQTSECTQATQRNLRKAGFHDWSALYCRPENDANHSVSQFKTNVRKHLTEQGYKIIVNMGDQQSDLRGGYAEKGFKLPNPFYYLP